MLDYEQMWNELKVKLAIDYTSLIGNLHPEAREVQKNIYDIVQYMDRKEQEFITESGDES